MTSVAWENLEPIQRAQLLHFYPQLREELGESGKEENNGKKSLQMPKLWRGYYIS